MCRRHPQAALLLLADPERQQRRTIGLDEITATGPQLPFSLQGKFLEILRLQKLLCRLYRMERRRAALDEIQQSVYDLIHKNPPFCGNAIRPAVLPIRILRFFVFGKIFFSIFRKLSLLYKIRRTIYNEYDSQ